MRNTIELIAATVLLASFNPLIRAEEPVARSPDDERLKMMYQVFSGYE